MSKDERLFDLRTLERNLAKGLITQKEYDAYLGKLEDVEDNMAVIEAEFEEGVLDDDEEEEAEGEQAESADASDDDED